MNLKIKDVFKESKIISFFAGLNKNLLIYFYNSAIYKFFIRINTFFKKAILENSEKSLIIKSAKKAAAHIRTKDIGIFIILVVLFNTLAMIMLKKEIDIFSGVARVFFFIFGVFLILVGGEKSPGK